MLDFLFRRLTAEQKCGVDMFDAVTRLARQRHWYVEGGVPDSIDGRFAVLATLTALVLGRLEREGGPGDAASVALTERFIEVMESEHREMGLGDPTLGKTVRKLVGALARRNELWRLTIANSGDWSSAVRQSLFKSDPPAPEFEQASRALAQFHDRLQQLELCEIEQGRLQ